MKIYDPASLERNVGVFTITAEIPESMYSELNADGTRPHVSIDIDAPTQLVALQVLAYLHSGEGLDVIMTSVMDQLFADKPDFHENGKYYEDTEESADAIFAAMEEVYSPWKKFLFEMEGKVVKDDVETVHPVTLAIHAPSASIAFDSFVGLTTNEMLNSLAAGFMPDAEDDDDEYDDDVNSW